MSAAQAHISVQKEFFEKRNMDLSAASKRAAQKRARSRRETIAHFGPAMDDPAGPASPCSGATRDSDMSGEAGPPADGAAAAAGASGPPLLPVIGEEEALSGMAAMDGGDDEDASRQRKLIRGVSTLAFSWPCMLAPLLSAFA